MSRAYWTSPAETGQNISGVDRSARGTVVPQELRHEPFALSEFGSRQVLSRLPAAACSPATTHQA